MSIERTDSIGTMTNGIPAGISGIMTLITGEGLPTGTGEQVNASERDPDPGGFRRRARKYEDTPRVTIKEGHRNHHGGLLNVKKGQQFPGSEQNPRVTIKEGHRNHHGGLLNVKKG